MNFINENFIGLLLGFLLGVFLVLAVQGLRDYGAVYEISQGEHKWQTYHQPEFDADGNWRFRDIGCNCEVILGAGFTIKRVR